MVKNTQRMESSVAYKRTILFLFTVAALGLAACDLQAPVYKWTEEILLQDGRRLLVERKDLQGGWAEPGQSGSTRERHISFANPDDPQKKYTHMITGSSNYLLLGFENGTPWLIVLVGPFSYETRCPIGTYETFSWSDDGWRSVSYATLPKAFTKVNMVADDQFIPGFDKRQGVTLSAEQIEQTIQKLKRNYVRKATWSLVQRMDEGNSMDEGGSIDCHYYSKQAGEEKK